jgi:hypothetical protein
MFEVPREWDSESETPAEFFFDGVPTNAGLGGIALFGMDQLLPVLQIFQSFTQLAEQGLSLRNLLIHMGIAPCARFASGSDSAHL